MNADDMSMLTELNLRRAAPWAASSVASTSVVSTLRPSATASTRRTTASATSAM
jgi:hypothetical protein